jgi:hypothetical protein
VEHGVLLVAVPLDGVVHLRDREVDRPVGIGEPLVLEVDDGGRGPAVADDSHRLLRRPTPLALAAAVLAPAPVLGPPAIELTEPGLLHATAFVPAD